jgi:hypothetical protein
MSESADSIVVALVLILATQMKIMKKLCENKTTTSDMVSDALKMIGEKTPQVLAALK